MPMRMTANVCSVIGTGVKKSGIDTCAHRATKIVAAPGMAIFHGSVSWSDLALCIRPVEEELMDCMGRSFRAVSRVWVKLPRRRGEDGTGGRPGLRVLAA